jgi:hypothetical protein
MTKELERLVEAARKVDMTPDDVREQRRSFAYGNTKIENADITRELVNKLDEELERNS